MADNPTINGIPVATDDVPGVGQVQFVKLAVSASDSAILIPADAANGLDVDVTRSALPTGAARQVDVEAVRDRFTAAAALGDADANPATTRVGAHTMLWTGGAWRRIRAASQSIDGSAGLGEIAVAKMLYNGSTWDRERGNTEPAEALASATRTATVTTVTMTNHGGRGILVMLNITAASGTGGLRMRVLARDGGGASYILAEQDVADFTATGQFAMELYPGASSAPDAAAASGWVVERKAGSVPRSFAMQIRHGDASSYTYSVDYMLIR